MLRYLSSRFQFLSNVQSDWFSVSSVNLVNFTNQFSRTLSQGLPVPVVGVVGDVVIEHIATDIQDAEMSDFGQLYRDPR